MAQADSWLVRLWRRTTLTQRLAFIALVPTLVTAVLLVTMLTRHQLAALHGMARNAADAIATQAATISAEPLRNMQRRELVRIAQSVVQLPHVSHVQIRAADGEILAESQAGAASRHESLTVLRDIAPRDDPHHPIGSVLVDVSLAEAIAAQRSSLRNALIALVLSLFVALVVGWQAARWISAPLRRLAAAVHRLGSGERAVAVAVTDDTEIGELQRGFNAASAALHDMHSGMERQIEQATQELARKNAALEAASVAKARFLAAASHDLRQPLYALTLFSSALAVDEHDPVRLDRIAHIQECVDALDHLFGELLDLSRLETGAMQLEIGEFPLDQVFDEVSRNFRMLAEQHGLRLVVRPTALWVRSDRTMLARILNNLVSNALRYTREGGVLVVARRRLDGNVRVDVWDTGSGIAPEHQARVFDEFYRVENPAGDRDDGPRRGLGLGLATVQRLAELLGTRVRLQSRHGRGSVFSFELPVVAARAGYDSLAAPEPPADVSGLRVLVIDDEPAILSGIRYLLRSWGCEVATAEDGAQAVEAAEDWPEPPDLVISDLRLRDGESGLDVLAALDRYYRRDGGPAFPRLLITGETRSDSLREIRAARIPVLYKPVSPQQLREAMMAAWTAARSAA
ncbi:ATP-binding response regulator [Fulvimonas soli]|jgi:signal transduction histidine kinase|uniref:histidine kinase n=1 Tax=Fulvimonas soli TaxID=155197 RepID=A0A316I7Q2_9GAMM|nr:hybrid sensor histidine kinase/response regulator [Fulvimonas soli]PWK88529.1 signal transduction histidine kinase [Fulvimonas soli]TNY27467.1 hybrid sensor histidine kinase/response regulator [Fulvimonas soli]